MRWLQGLLKRLRGESYNKADTRGNKPAQQQIETRLPVNLDGLEEALEYTIRHKDVFVQALVHRSYLQQTNQHGQSNERLEFLGDSILNLIIGEYLYRTFPDADEGELTKMRSRLVNRKALVAYSRSIHLSKYILMSQSAAQSLGKGSETIVADTFEAIVAALYLDGGYVEARRFVELRLSEALRHKTVITSDENYKSMLLEYAQANGLGVPRYSIIREEGPDHDRTFTVVVTLNNRKSGEGVGKNKKEAEQAAASMALERLQDTQ